MDGRSGQNRYDNEDYLGQCQPRSKTTCCTNTTLGMTAWEWAFQNTVELCNYMPPPSQIEKIPLMSLG